MSDVVSRFKIVGENAAGAAFRQVVGDAQSTANKVKRAFAGAFAGFSAFVAVRAIITETAAAEKAFAQLAAAVKSTGGVAGFTAEQLAGMSTDLQKVTTYADDTIQSMQSVLLTFTRIRGPEFEAAQEAILNVATRMGTDLTAAAVQVGKALNDPIRGMAGLRKAGIQFSEGQEKTIKALVETGRIAEAQRVILKELETQFGGAARAARNNFGGALEGLKNAFSDLLEAKSGLPAATAAINDFSAALADPDVKRGADNLIGLFLQLGVAATSAAAGIGALLTPASDLDDQVEGLNLQIREMQAVVDQGGSVTARMFGRGGEEVEDARSKIVELRLEIGRLKREAMGQAGGPQNSRRNALPPARTGFTDPAGADEKEIERLRKAGEAALASLASPGEKLRANFEATRASLEGLLKVAPEMAPQVQEALARLAATTQEQIEALSQPNLESIRKVGEELIRSFESPGEAIRRKFEEARASLVAFMEAFPDLAPEAQEALERLVATTQEELDELARLPEVVKEATDKMSVFAEQGARNLQTYFADFLFDPFEDGIRGMLKGFVDVLRRMVAEAAAARIFDALGLGGKGGGILGAILGGIFGGGTSGSSSVAGARAMGGSVSAGSLYRVNEDDTEFFRPSVSGEVIPLGKMDRGQGRASVTVAPVYHIDARGASVELVQRLPAILREANRAAVAEAEALIVGRIQRRVYDLG